MRADRTDSVHVVQCRHDRFRQTFLMSFLSFCFGPLRFADNRSSSEHAYHYNTGTTSQSSNRCSHRIIYCCSGRFSQHAYHYNTATTSQSSNRSLRHVVTCFRTCFLLLPTCLLLRLCMFDGRSGMFVYLRPGAGLARGRYDRQGPTALEQLCARRQDRFC